MTSLAERERRVIVVSDNPLSRTGLEVLVRSLPGLSLLGSASVADGAALSGQLRPDAILLDAGAGEAEDLEAIARLAAAQPGLPIVALAASTSGLTQALSFGASALLPQDADSRAVGVALDGATVGLVSVARADVGSLLPPLEGGSPPVQAPLESLTPRELEVLQWMARGLTNRQIGQRLQISEHTVKFHAAAVLGKLGAQSRAEAVARGISLGWILV